MRRRHASCCGGDGIALRRHQRAQIIFGDGRGPLLAAQRFYTACRRRGRARRERAVGAAVTRLSKNKFRRAASRLVRDAEGRLTPELQEGCTTMFPNLHINVLFEAPGCAPIVAEVQIHHEAVLAVSKQDHKLYEIKRAKSIAALAGRSGAVTVVVKDEKKLAALAAEVATLKTRAASGEGQRERRREIVRKLARENAELDDEVRREGHFLAAPLHGLRSEAHEGRAGAGDHVTQRAQHVVLVDAVVEEHTALALAAGHLPIEEVGDF